MELSTADIKAIKDLLDELPKMKEQHGYPYVFGASLFWLKRIVEQSDAEIRNKS